MPNSMSFFALLSGSAQELHLGGEILCCTLTRTFSESAPLLRRWGYVINGTCRATVLEQGKLRGVDTWVRPILHVLSR